MLTYMAGKKGVMKQPCDKSRRAAKILWAAEGYSSVREAMLIAGFTEEESKDRTVQQNIRRLIEKVIPRALEEKYPSPVQVSIVKDPLTGQEKREQHWRHPNRDTYIIAKKAHESFAAADTPIIRKRYPKGRSQKAGRNQENSLCLSEEGDKKPPAKVSVSKNPNSTPTPTSLLFSPDDVSDDEEDPLL
jgi:hypothetical protein